MLPDRFHDTSPRCVLELSNPWCVQDLHVMKSLQLRYFTPREVANLLGFPREAFRYVPMHRAPPSCLWLVYTVGVPVTAMEIVPGRSENVREVCLHC